MIELRKDDLLNIDGGINITAALLTSIYRGIGTIMDLGRSLGTAIRRIGSNNLCRM